MIILILTTITFGGMMMSRMNNERELYAPKGYLATLQARPRSVF
jgi:hypothetical protein